MRSNRGRGGNPVGGNSAGVGGTGRDVPGCVEGLSVAVGRSTRWSVCD